MSIVAVFGSRKGVNRVRVEDWMRNLYEHEPEDVIVSGGAEGVDIFAEQAWLALGGKVVSFRPVKIDPYKEEPQWDVERWDLGIDEPSRTILWDQPIWADFRSAAAYRNLLIAEAADKGVAFWYRRSRGTSGTIDAFKAENKPIYVYEEK